VVDTPIKEERLKDDVSEPKLMINE